MGRGEGGVFVALLQLLLLRFVGLKYVFPLGSVLPLAFWRFAVTLFLLPLSLFVSADLGAVCFKAGVWGLAEHSWGQTG